MEPTHGRMSAWSRSAGGGRPSFVAAVVLFAAQSALAMQICARDDGTGNPRSNSKLTLRETCTAGKEVQIGTTEGLAALSEESAAVLAAMSLEDSDADTIVDAVRFTGVNVQVVSGSGATDGAVNGLGNLIVGYNEEVFSGSPRGGSHNLVVGSDNGYSSYGGLVAGWNNSSTAPFASVSGGLTNIASGWAASISGGGVGTASGPGASVSGGYGNDATAYRSWVGGGIGNVASGETASVSGGHGNVASGTDASVSGGRCKMAGDGPLPSCSAGAKAQHVSGGFANLASGDNSVVSGGQSNEATGSEAVVAGGYSNVSSGNNAAVSGGQNGTASANNATVGGGNGVTSSVNQSWHASQTAGFPSGAQY